MRHAIESVGIDEIEETIILHDQNPIDHRLQHIGHCILEPQLTSFGPAAVLRLIFESEQMPVAAA